jgi:5-methyltetrahydropteroyltriglutamate--homocysteine methyltransferase
MLDACIELDNAIIDGHPGMTFGIHICRGNTRACSTHQGATIRIAEQVFRRRAVRSVSSSSTTTSGPGTFEPPTATSPRRPPNGHMCLGLVRSTKRARLESTARSSRALECHRAARVVSSRLRAPEPLSPPQCVRGSTSTSEGQSPLVRRTAPLNEQRPLSLDLVEHETRSSWYVVDPDSSPPAV